VTTSVVSREFLIGEQQLEGLLKLPPHARGLVIFAHGSGSSRFSRRNNFVAAELRRLHLGTLLFDLLTPPEAMDRQNVFDIPLLGARVLEAIEWARQTPLVAALPIGLFGASTGAAAALVAAARRPADVAAVVSRGGRPDLAGAALGSVRAPTLLIVGGADVEVLGISERAAAELACEHRIEVVPGATHLFEEPGALEQVVELAGGWFQRYLKPAAGLADSPVTPARVAHELHRR
jgi:putative phosphoribosyl transferase